MSEKLAHEEYNKAIWELWENHPIIVEDLCNRIPQMYPLFPARDEGMPFVLFVGHNPSFNGPHISGFLQEYGDVGWNQTLSRTEHARIGFD